MRRIKNILINIPFFEIALALYLPLSSYCYGFSNLGFILLLLATFICIIIKKELYFYKQLFIFLTFICFTSLLFFLFAANLNTCISVVSNYFIMSFILLCSLKFINIKYLFISFLVVGILSFIGLGYQWIYLQWFGNTVKPIRFLPLPTEVYYSNRFSSYQDRPMSIFLEPSQYVTFIYILIIISFNLKKYFCVIFFSITSILSKSSTAYIFLIITILFILLTILKSNKLNFKYKLFILAFGLCLIVLGCIIFSFQGVFEKIFSTNSSTINRVFSGFEVWTSLDLPSKLFGAGFYSMDVLLESGYINIPLSQYVTLGFANGFSLVLIQFGLIGFFLFGVYLFSCLKKLPTIANFYCFSILFLHNCSESIFFNSAFLIYHILFNHLTFCSFNKKDYLIFTFLKKTKDGKIKIISMKSSMHLESKDTFEVFI